MVFARNLENGWKRLCEAVYPVSYLLRNLVILPVSNFCPVVTNVVRARKAYVLVDQ